MLNQIVADSLLTYTDAFPAVMKQALPVVATAAVAVLSLKLAINYGLMFFKKFSGDYWGGSVSDTVDNYRHRNDEG